MGPHRPWEQTSLSSSTVGIFVSVVWLLQLYFQISDASWCCPSGTIVSAQLIRWSRNKVGKLCQTVSRVNNPRNPSVEVIWVKLVVHKNKVICLLFCLCCAIATCRLHFRVQCTSGMSVDFKIKVRKDVNKTFFLIMIWVYSYNYIRIFLV